MKINADGFKQYQDLIRFKNLLILISKNIDIGKMVYDCRKSKGLSQQDLADAIDCHQGTISNIEQRSRYKSIIKFQQICILKRLFAYLEIDIEDMYRQEIEKNENEEKLTLQIITDICKMDLIKKKLIYDFMLNLD